MKLRTAALVGAIVAVVPFVPTPAAVATSSHSAAAEHRRIASYWTAERRASAIPRAMARPGGGGGGGGGTVTGATWTGGGEVAKTTGKLFFTEAGVRYTCSGSAVDSAHGNLVLTAGHCVHGGGSGQQFVTNWIFYPAWNGSPSPSLGAWTATDLATTTGWADARDFDDDAGFAVVTNGTTATLESVLAVTHVPAFVSSATVSSYSFGYPAAKKYKGNTLTYCAGVPALGRDGNQTMSMACDMTGGSSGGPWLQGGPSGNIHSLNSYGYSSLQGVMFGPIFGAAEQAAFTGSDVSPDCPANPSNYRCVDYAG